MASDIVRTDRDDLEVRAGTIVEYRGSPAFRLFARDFPAQFPARRRVSGDIGTFQLVDLKNEEAADEDGCGAKALGVLERTQGSPPSKLACGAVREQPIVFEEDVDVGAIGDRSDGGRMVE